MYRIGAFCGTLAEFKAYLKGLMAAELAQRARRQPPKSMTTAA